MEQCISEAVIWERLKNKNTNKWNLCRAEKRRWQKRGEGKKRESRGGEVGHKKCAQGRTEQMSKCNPNRTHKTPCCYCVAVKLHHKHHGHRWGDLNKHVWTLGPGSDLQVG